MALRILYLDRALYSVLLLLLLLLRVLGPFGNIADKRREGEQSQLTTHNS